MRFKFSIQIFNLKCVQSENAILPGRVAVYVKQWRIIASQICAHWEKCINPDLKEGSWTFEEDEPTKEHVDQNGPEDWPSLCKLLPHRGPKQRRE
jgi:hypothetical protein